MAGAGSADANGAKIGVDDGGDAEAGAGAGAAVAVADC